MEPNLNRRLDEATVLSIKALFWEGATQDALAERFNVSQTTISRIIRGKQWADVNWPNGERGALPLEKIMERKVFGLSTKGARTYIDEGAIENVKQAFKDKYPDPMPPDGGGVQFNKDHDSMLIGPDNLRNMKDVIKETRPTVEELEADRERQTRLRAAKTAALEQQGEAAEAAMNEELAGVLTSTDHTPREPREGVQHEGDLDILTWEHIVRVAPGNRIVLLGLEDKSVRPAICQAFTALPEADWKTDRAFKLVQNVYKIMEKENGDAENS